jgi:phenylalanine ammonia-lyase
MAAVVLGDSPLRLEQIAAVARDGAPVSVAAETFARVDRGRAHLERLLADGRRIYGVNTGVGADGKRPLDAERVDEFQRKILDHLTCGAGRPLPTDVVRGATLLRLRTLSLGYSGVRREIVQGLAELLNHGITPIVPRYGSLGASGDLIPSAYIGRVLTGVGDVEHRGQVMPAARALEACGLRPIALGAKEGIALVNGTTVMTSVAALVWLDSRRALRALLGAVALAMEALGAPPGPYAPWIHEAKQHPGQIAVAAHVRALVEGSRNLKESSVQSCYSIRCPPQGLGPAWEALEDGRRVIEREANSANDNPLIDDGGHLHQAGNFYGGHVARTLDGWKLDLSVMASWAHALVAVLVDERFSAGLPALLVREPGFNAGFKGVQLCVTSLACAVRQLAAPSLIHSLPSDQYNQDIVSLGLHAALTAHEAVEYVRVAVAQVLFAAAQAVDMRGREGLGAGTQRLHQAVRARVAIVERDRPLEPDVSALAAAIAAGELEV